MTNLQTAQMNMFVLLAEMLQDADPVALQRVTQLAADLTEIGELIPLLEAASAEKLLHSYSAKGSKQQIRNRLVDRIMRVIKALKAFAVASEQPDLLRQFKFSKSTVAKAPDQLLLEIAANVHAFAVANEAALVPFNATKSDANALSTDTEAFREIASQPRKNDLARTAAGKRVAGYNRQILTIVKRADFYVETLPGIEDELYAMYKERRPVLHSSRHNQVIGFVTDEEGNPLENVTVIIEDLSRSTETSAKGGFRFMTLPDGVYTLRFSRPGYQDLLHVITISRGLRQSPKIQMRAI